MHTYHSAIINLTPCLYVALSTAFAKMNVRFTDRLRKNVRKKKEELSMKS